MRTKYYDYAERYFPIPQTDKIKNLVEEIGKISLSDGLNIAKFLITNYFEDDKSSEKIIKLIEKEKLEMKKKERIYINLEKGK